MEKHSVSKHKDKNILSKSDNSITTKDFTGPTLPNKNNIDKDSKYNKQTKYPKENSNIEKETQSFIKIRENEEELADETSINNKPMQMREKEECEKRQKKNELSTETSDGNKNIENINKQSNKLEELNQQTNKILENFTKEKQRIILDGYSDLKPNTYNISTDSNKSNKITNVLESKTKESLHPYSYTEASFKHESFYSKLLNMRDEKIKNLLSKNQENDMKLIAIRNERDSLKKAIEHLLQKYNPPGNKNYIRHNCEY